MRFNPSCPAARLLQTVPCALFALVAACGSGAGGEPLLPREASDGGAASAGEGTGATANGLHGEAQGTLVVPAGVQCIVASMSGSTTMTVSTAVAAGATTATVSFGVLNPGAVSVVANAYGTACPATGLPSWVGDAVQATIVAGETTSIPLILHAAASGTGTLTFAQPAVALAAGLTTTYAVLADGTVRAWGNNANGEFGTGAAGAFSSTPVTVPGVANVTQMAAGLDYACALRKPDGSVVCWGDDTPTNLLNFHTYGATATAFVPPTVQTGLVVGQIFAGVYGIAFLAPDGTYGWNDGPNTYWGTAKAISVAAPCGGNAVSSNASQTNLVTPEAMVNVYGGATNLVPNQVASQVFQGVDQGGVFTCSLIVNGTVFCWGDNSYGQLATGGTSTASSETEAAPFQKGATRAVSLALGRSPGAPGFACATAQDGTVYCSGSGAQGQQGNGSSLSNLVFTQIPGLSSAIQVVAGAAHACALLADGSVQCWGNNDLGQLGDGTVTTRFSPVAVGAW